MKRTLSIIISVLLIAVLLAGCGSGSGSDSSTQSGSQNEGLLLAVSLNDADEFRSSWLSTFKTQATAAGHRVIDTNAASDASKQISDMESLIAQKPDVIIMHAYSFEGSTPALDAAAAANIPVILVDFPVESDNYTARISDEQGLNGVNQANYVKAWLAEDSSREIRMGYLVGTYDAAGAMPRRDKLYSELGLSEGDGKLLAELEGGWGAPGAMSITEDWLQAYPDMNIFACMNDDMAIGVIQALRAAGKDLNEVIVMGVDGSDAAKEYLASGELAMTSGRNLEVETKFALDVAEKIAAGQSISNMFAGDPDDAKLIHPNAILPMTRSGAATVTVVDTQGDALLLAVSLNDADEFRSSWLSAFKAQAEGDGHRVIDTNAASDASKQISDMESLIAQKPDVIIMHAYSFEGSTPALEAATAAGIPVILVDFPVESDNYTARISDEQGLNGINQANYIKAWLAEDSSREIRMGYLVGTYDAAGAMPRRDKLYSELGLSEGDGKLLAELEGGWGAPGAMSITEDWLQAYPDMNIIACMNDDMAIGVIQALSAAGKNFEEVLVLGVDGSDAAKEYLASGELAMTSGRNLEVETIFALNVAKMIAAGQSIDSMFAGDPDDAKLIHPNAILPLTR